jgi:phosphate transport system substrate-binding protein
VKAAHLKAIKGLKEYVEAFATQWGPDGTMKAKGMVVAPQDVRTRNAEIVKTMQSLDPSALK